MGVFVEFLITFALSFVCGAAVYLIAFWVGKRRYNADPAQSHARDRSRWFDYVFVFMFCVYTGGFTTLSLLRHLSINSGYDLAQYDQIIWNSLHGRLFEQTYITDAPMFLGKSFTPILLALVPLYAIWRDPMILLVLQTVALGVVAFPLYWLARKKTGHLMALGLVLAYFLSPVVERVNVTDFHEIVLAAPLLAFATWFLLREHYRGFFVCLGLALLVKEEVAFVAIIFGVYILLFQHRRWLGFALALTGAVLVLVLLQYVIPLFSGTSTFYYFNGTGRYAYLGNSLSGILATLLTKPALVAQHLLIPAKFEFVLHFLVPLAFLPLAGVEIALLALPTLGYSLLSDYYPQFSINYPYTPPLIPFMFFAATLGASRLLAKDGRFWFLSKPNLDREVEHRARSFSAVTMIVVASGLSYWLYGPAPLARGFDAALYTVTPNAMEGRTLAASIPQDAIVVAAGEWVAQLSERQSIYNVEDPSVFRRADYLFTQEGRPWFELRKATWEDWFSNGYFEIVKQADGFVIARRRAPQIPLQIQFDNHLSLMGVSVWPTSEIQGGSTLRAILVWHAEKGIAHNYQIVVRVTDGQGHVWAESQHETDQGFTPINQYEVDKPVADVYELKLPPTMPGGNYRITVSARKVDGPLDLVAWSVNGDSLGTDAGIASVTIVKNKESILASDLWIEQPLYVDMQEMRFIGYVPIPTTLHAGDTLSVGLYWRARAKPAGDYVVAVQLRDAMGQTAFEQTARPANGTYPTTEWNAGEVLLDWHDFVLPRSLAVGEYQIYAVLRDNAGTRVLGEVRIARLSVVR
jgi:uncharacterized membrane protein